MKAISIWQPWATAIAIGLKRFETRGWATSHRGTIAIHAAKRWTKEQKDIAEMWATLYGFVPHLPLGGVVAVAALVSVEPTETVEIERLEYSFGDFNPGRFAWKLEDVVELDKVFPVEGKQGIFEIPDAGIQNAVKRSMEQNLIF